MYQKICQKECQKYVRIDARENVSVFATKRMTPVLYVRNYVRRMNGSGCGSFESSTVVDLLKHCAVKLLLPHGLHFAYRDTSE